jgi:uncharacterized repeat protein (TIGR03803 family)
LVAGGCSSQSSLPNGNAPAYALSRTAQSAHLISPIDFRGNVRPLQVTGAYPWETLIKVGPKLYGTAEDGGANNVGVIFKSTLSGAESVVHDFNTSDGSYPISTLIKVGCCLYGTTTGGGANGFGTIFIQKLSVGGGLGVIHHFAGTDGATPVGRLIKASGVLYGVTNGGGAFNCGTVFKINVGGGGFASLYSFQGGTDGCLLSGGLVKVGSYFYGTTQGGGLHSVGTLFKINAAGSYSKIYDFQAGADGAIPYAPLTKVGSVLYGVTSQGGTANSGTFFKATTSGAETTLYSFLGGADGQYPTGGLIKIGSSLFGTTQSGGTAGSGTLYSVPITGGSDSVLHSFGGAPSDGATPNATLLKVGTTLYGTTAFGGTNNLGTLFKSTFAGSESPIYSF